MGVGHDCNSHERAAYGVLAILCYLRGPADKMLDDSSNSYRSSASVPHSLATGNSRKDGLAAE